MEARENERSLEGRKEGRRGKEEELKAEEVESWEGRNAKLIKQWEHWRDRHRKRRACLVYMRA